MNLPKTKLLWVGLGLFTILLIAEAILLTFSGSRLLKEQKELKKSYELLARLQNRVPFPSRESVQTLRDNLEELEYRTVSIVAEMDRDPFPRDAVESADFSARAQKVIERFRQQALQAGVVLPDSLEAGFADYASGGLVPDARHVPRLTRQLYSAERIADVLIRGGVDSIDRLDRDRFELAAPPANQRRPRREPRDAESQRSVASEIGPFDLSLIHISEPTRRTIPSRMPSSA